MAPTVSFTYSSATMGDEVSCKISRAVARFLTISLVDQNLTMRMNMRRFTRLTNGFSKKVENHAAAVALHFMHYNFARIHKTLRITPAMAAGVASHVWSIAEIVSLLEIAEEIKRVA